MQQFFNGLYTVLISWFYHRKPSSFGIYKAEIFNTVGLYTLLISLVSMITFYYLFNHRFSTLNSLEISKPRHWVYVLLLAAGLGAWVAYRTSIGQGVAPDGYLRYFIIVNALVAIFWYLVFTALGKHWSLNARTKPL